MCSDPKVASEVQERLDAGEPFTSACISHPIISADHQVRHRDVSSAIREMWRHGEMIGSDGPYCRTSITVWPGGPGSIPQTAWLYHPDQFDPQTFKPTSRVLVRNVQDEDGDDPVVNLTNTADGSTIQKQCQVQRVETTLNIPRTLIKKIGWNAGDNLTVDVTGSTVVVKKTADSSVKRKVDAEGRIRLHGATLDALQTTFPVALLVTPNGADDYIQVSALTTPPATTTTPAPDADATAADGADISAKKGVSVWD